MYYFVVKLVLETVQSALFKCILTAFSPTPSLASVLQYLVMKHQVDCHLLQDSSFQNYQGWKKNKFEFETWARSGCEMKKGRDKLSSDFINLKLV